MRLAARCLCEERAEWARAMRGEFQAATLDGRPLSFALGCLLAAWRQMPTQEEGRFVLANHVLALGLLIPMAALQLACAAGFPFLPLGQSAILANGAAQRLYLADAYPAAAPSLLALWLLLGVAHLRLAWLVLERDWQRVVQAASMIIAASATLVIFTVVLFLDGGGAGLQLVLLGVELLGLHQSAAWHARLVANRSPVCLIG
jgi:hypothetical protein